MHRVLTIALLGGVVACSTNLSGEAGEAGEADGPDAGFSDAGPSTRPERPDADLPDAGPDAGQPFSLRVEAVIDGRSRLVVRADTAYWHHIDHAAPGRHNGADHPTVINGVAWQPEWPSAGENRSCRCDSSVFEGVLPVLPAEGMAVTLRKIDVRSKAHIVQAPTADNDHTLIIELDDNGPGGSRLYVVEIDLD